ncbi:hypothetical protein AV530_016643 [Patagioenas fasciata monilis]|uniref:Uncharacterized protein n=1 Tax=Patagioenas fasciata monilis TaxID=372326 RepID=A0A1V4J312_PATFA|nr:hypothetical protein AV530_016643 [Patagioenas fasciata monilis]
MNAKHKSRDQHLDQGFPPLHGTKPTRTADSFEWLSLEAVELLSFSQTLACDYTLGFSQAMQSHPSQLSHMPETTTSQISPSKFTVQREGIKEEEKFPLLFQLFQL